MTDGESGSCDVEAIGVSIVRTRMPVLRDINITVERGGSVAVVGPNGSGKSTLLKCIAGAVRPTGGDVRWFGTSVTRSPAVRRQIGFAGHESGLYADLTAWENLVFAGRMHGVQRIGDRARELLAAAGLESAAHRPARQLSQGARQRLAMARALVHDPQLIVLDEPFANLDVEGRQWLENLFQLWRCARRTVCFASHDIPQSRVLADRMIWLSRGRIEAIELANHESTVSVRSA